MTQKYCIDTSMFINGWTKHYPPEVFSGLWDEIDRLIDEEVLFSCEAVYEELVYQDDELANWAKERKHIFHPPTEDVTHEMSHVMYSFPNFAAQGGSGNGADPWIIAHSKVIRAVLVTDEQKAHRNQRTTKPPKIPDVCEELGITWMNPTKFFVATELNF